MPCALHAGLPGADGRADALKAAERLAAAIETRGYALVDGFVDGRTTSALRARLDALDAAGRMKPASVGRVGGRARDGDIRGDRTCWLDVESTDPHERILAQRLETVRLAVNERLALGLFDFEGHYAVYPAGAGYARHRDRFADDDARVLSVVLYLNDTLWLAADGGALQLFVDQQTVEVTPSAGTLVAFLSERFDHRVMPARRVRRSIAGWFSRRRG